MARSVQEPASGRDSICFSSPASTAGTIRGSMPGARQFCQRGRDAPRRR